MRSLGIRARERVKVRDAVTAYQDPLSWGGILISSASLGSTELGAIDRQPCHHGYVPSLAPIALYPPPTTSCIVRTSAKDIPIQNYRASDSTVLRRDSGVRFRFQNSWWDKAESRLQLRPQPRLAPLLSNPVPLIPFIPKALQSPF